ncbi:efflux RND transporter permease subunit, partial [bacterium]|nr:efflux RND transporter permease subunit [bacterium]
MIAWFIRNGVAANLLMLLILAGGILGVASVNVRMFPKLDLHTVTVNVVYPGAAPEEVERSLVLPIEEAVQGLEGIKELRSEAQESIGTVLIEAERGYSMAKLKENVKTRVDAIITFPTEAERPIVDELVFSEEIIRIAIVADSDQLTLRQIAAQSRDDLLRLPGISQVKLDGLPDLEIAIEVDEETLRRYGLTFEEVANAVRRSSSDFPGGSVKTEAAEILLRVKQQAYTGQEFEDLVLRATPDGTRITLGDVATVRDAFTDSRSVSLFDGKPAAFLVVYAVGNETPINVSNKVNQFIEAAGERYPKTIQF